MSAAKNESLRDARTSAWQLRKRVKLIVKSKWLPNCIQSLLSLLVQFAAFLTAMQGCYKWNQLHLDGFESLRQSACRWTAVKREETEHSKREEQQGHEREALIDGEVVTRDRRTDADSQTLFSIVDSQCLYICVKRKRWTVGRGLVQSLQPAKDTIVTVIIQLQSRTISWVRSWREIWADTAHFIRTVDSFWLIFSLRWHCWRFFCFEMTVLTPTRIQKMKHICLRGCYHSVLWANCNIEQRAVGSSAQRMPEIRNASCIAGRAKGQYAIDLGGWHLLSTWSVRTFRN